MIKPMPRDKCSPFHRPGDPLPRGTAGDPNRRTRLSPHLPRDLRGWLRRTAVIHAHLLTAVRLYARPERAGGRSLEGDTYAARAARGDRTLLHEALTFARDEIDAIRDEVEEAIDAVEATAAPPGSAAKVAVMAERVRRGEAVFAGGDAEG